MSYENLQRSDIGPGSAFAFDNLRELDIFQDVLAGLIKPQLNEKVWSRRTKISDLLRPDGFNGNIDDIVLQGIEDPYERLVTSELEFPGLSIPRYFPAETPDRDFLDETTFGFEFRAIGSSSRGLLGLIKAEVYFVDLNPTRKAARKPKKPYVPQSDQVDYAYYDEERGEKVTVWAWKKGTPDVTLRRVVSRPERDEAAMAQIQNTGSISGAGGRGTLVGSMPSSNYNS